MQEKQYTLDELKLGMRVKTSQLSNIYDTYILLADPKSAVDGEGFSTVEGKIVFIGDEQSNGYAKAYNENIINGWSPAVFIQRHTEIEGVYYE